jgi:hypothetical protein
MDSAPAARRPGRIWRNASASAGSFAEVYMCTSGPPLSGRHNAGEFACDKNERDNAHAFPHPAVLNGYLAV